MKWMFVISVKGNQGNLQKGGWGKRGLATTVDLREENARLKSSQRLKHWAEDVLLVTADDDRVLDATWLGNLLRCHEEHPDNQECLRYLVGISKELGQPLLLSPAGIHLHHHETLCYIPQRRP